MKTLFPKYKIHIPKWYIVDATNCTLGRLSSVISNLLQGKETSFFTPGVNQGNFVVVINANQIQVSGRKEVQKKYYRNSQRPGSLKIETFKDLKNRFPTKILESSIWGMLPKTVLGRTYFKNLYIYSDNNICFKKLKNNEDFSLNKNWIHLNLSHRQ